MYIKEGTQTINLSKVPGASYIYFTVKSQEDCEVSFSVDVAITTSSSFGSAQMLTAGGLKKLAGNTIYNCRVSDISTTFTVTATMKCSHEYTSDGKCSKCGATCEHPSWYYSKCEVCGMECPHISVKEGTIYIDDSGEDEQYHIQSYDCITCGAKAVKEQKIAHTWKIAGVGGEGKHREECQSCDAYRYVSCTTHHTVTKHITEFSEMSTYHLVEYICQCGNAYTRKKEAHVYKKNVCKVCDFKRIVPGKIKINKAKQANKLKKKRGTERGHWDSFGNWIPQRKYVYYTTKIQVTIKKAKNVYGYNIVTSKSKVSNTVTTKNKTYSLNFYHYSGKKPKKLTVYVTPISKTGTLGKTVKKTVKLK